MRCANRHRSQSQAVAKAESSPPIRATGPKRRSRAFYTGTDRLTNPMVWCGARKGRQWSRGERAAKIIQVCNHGRHGRDGDSAGRRSAHSHAGRQYVGITPASAAGTGSLPPNGPSRSRRSPPGRQWSATASEYDGRPARSSATAALLPAAACVPRHPPGSRCAPPTNGSPDQREWATSGRPVAQRRPTAIQLA